MTNKEKLVVLEQIALYSKPAKGFKSNKDWMKHQRNMFEDIVSSFTTIYIDKDCNCVVAIDTDTNINTLLSSGVGMIRGEDLYEVCLELFNTDENNSKDVYTSFGRQIRDMLVRKSYLEVLFILAQDEE